MTLRPWLGQPLFEELEPRILYSADLSPLAAAAAPVVDQRLVSAAHALPAAAPQAATLLFIDERVAPTDARLAAWRGAQVSGALADEVTIAADEDGAQRMAEVMAQQPSGSRWELLPFLGEAGPQLGSSPVDGLQPQTEARPATELVFIDAQVAGATLLLDDIQAQAAAGRAIEAVLLQPGADALSQIGQALQGRTGLGALHLIGHGEASLLMLAGSVLDAGALEQRAAEIAAWRSALTDEADLLVYGCDVAAGSSGLAFVQALARLTGADVAASDDATGARALGGDWQLEVQQGAIQASLAIAASGQAAFVATLANSAPVLTPSAPVLKSLATLDRSNAGQTVASFLTGQVRDADAGSASGIVVTGTAGNEDGWQYSVDGGATWAAVGSVSAGSALALREQDLIRLVPIGSSADSATFTFRAWDQTSGSAGSKLNASTTGGSTAFSAAADTATLDVVVAADQAPQFGTGGQVITNLGTAQQYLHESMLQADGKLVVAGAFNNLTGGLVRYNTDGSLDTGFGTGGIATVALAGGFGEFHAVAQQADGKIVAAGYAFSGGVYGFTVVRLLSNGSLDMSFGTSGRVFTTFHAADDEAIAAGVQIQSDGKIVVGGTTGSSSKQLLAVARYTSSGALDTTFATGGKLRMAIGADVYVDDMTMDASGRMLISGSADSGGAYHMAVVRLTTSGSLDTSFGGDGTVIGSGTRNGGEAYAVAVQSDGKVVLAGVDESGGGLLLRYTSAGVLDTSFGSGGETHLSLAPVTHLADLLVQADGRLVASGHVSAGKSVALVVRLQSDGTLDNSFGRSGPGYTTVTYSTGTDRGFTLVGQADGKVLVSGSAATSTRWATARLTTTGELDTSWNNTGPLGGNVAFTENGSAVVLDGDVIAYDMELATAGNYGGATLQIQRSGGASADDVFSATGLLGALTPGGALVHNGTTIGTVTANGGGTLLLTFNGSATQSNLNSALRLVAYRNTNDAPPASVALQWTLADGNTGAQGAGGNLTATGSTTVAITAVNDAPVLTAAAPTLDPITEDDANPAGQTVASFVGGSLADADGAMAYGIAVTALVAGNGTWQYSLDAGAGWTAIGTVSGSSALLLRSTDLVRLVPNGSNGTSASLTYRGWDQASGSAGSKVSTASNGGSTAFSTATDTATLSVASVNDAPVMSAATPALATITEEQTGNTGSTVATLVGSSITDVDSGAVEGIAITAATTTAGAWQYSLDGGASWQALGSVADASALLLRSTDRIRVLPDGLNGGSASLSYRAWDQTTGSAGSLADAASGGGSSAFGSTANTASLGITAVNDAPVLTATTRTMAPIAAVPGLGGLGQTVAAIVGDTITDVDSGARKGIVITQFTAGSGQWQYSFNGGSSWQDFDHAAAAGTQGYVMPWDARLRYLPGSTAAETAGFQYRAWDRSAHDSAYDVTSVVSVGSPGGSSSFSAALATVTLQVGATAPNQAPQFGGNGVATVRPDAWGANRAHDVAVQADGKLVLAGTGQLAGTVIRLNTDGTLDTSFGSGGKVSLDLYGENILRSVTVLPDGRILASGYMYWDSSPSYGQQLLVQTFRLLPNGSVDGSFNTFMDNDGSSLDRYMLGEAMAPLSDGKVLVAGTIKTLIDEADPGMLFLSRLRSDGFLDTTFGSGGHLKLTLSLDTQATGIAVDGSGRILVSGFTGTGGQYTSFVLRTSAAGVLDTTFGTNGVAMGSAGKAYELVVLPDGSVVTAGSSADDGQAVLQRFGADGTLDAGFGSGGVQTLALGAEAGLRDLVRLADGRLLASGFITTLGKTDMLAVRMLADGTLDTGFGSNGLLVVRASAEPDIAHGIVVRPDGQIALAGGEPEQRMTYSFNFGRLAVDNLDTVSAPGFSAALRTADGQTATAWRNGSTLGGTVSYTENGAAVVLDNDVSVVDAELAAQGHYAGATLQIQRSGGADGTDLFSATGTLGMLTPGGALVVGGVTIGTVTANAGGTLQLGFNSNATQARLDSALRQIAYANSGNAPAATVSMLWTFSDGTLTGSGSTLVQITAVNDAPLLTAAAPVLATISEDAGSHGGQTVASFVGSSLADPDGSVSLGVAITSLLPGSGVWQYSLDGGASWQAIGTVSNTAALLLRSDDRVRLLPDGLDGTTASLTYRGWDQTSGSAGSKQSTATNGGSSAFSTATDTAVLTVTPVNDAPVMASAAPLFNTLTEDTTNPGGRTVAEVLGSSLSDVDGGAKQGIAIVGISSVNGSGQYSVDGGATWQDAGSVSDGAALLLRSTDLIRFTPDGRNGGTSTIDYRGWDQSSGTAGSKASTSVNGGTSAFSTRVNTASVVVTSVNDAPVLTPGAPGLAAIDENATNPAGQTVASFIGGSITDVDSGAIAGIALVGSSAPAGSWQYSLDGGASWQAVGSVSANTALLLRTTDRLRLLPDGLNGGTATLTWRAWDQTTGSAGSTASTSSNGGSTAFSSATDTASLLVAAVNDAPVMAAATPVLTPINEDATANAGHTVASLVAGTITDVDSGALQGIALTATGTTTGSWQYSLDDGASWAAVGSVSPGAALLLRSVDRVRLLPDGQNGGSATFSYRAWDLSSGSAGSLADTGSGGGSSAFSTGSNTAGISVTSVNDAPVLAPAAPALSAIDENTTASSGQTVASFVGGSITDVDGGAVAGIAITSASAGNGSWQFSTDGGGSWQAVGTVTANSALLLRSTDRVRFVPDGLNATSASLGYRAWDQTSGSAGSKHDASGSGGSSAFSSATDTATISITAVNDAPVLMPLAPVLPAIGEDDGNPAGQTVASFVGGSIADVDAGALQGIALTATSGSGGQWQFSTDAGGSWQAVGTVSDGSARLLRSTDLLRFVPDGLNGGSAGIGWRAWDRSSGSAGALTDTSANGGSTAFSTATDSATLTINAANDAPVLTPAAPVLAALTEDQSNGAGQTVAALVGSSITDVDSGALQGIALTAASATAGAWQYSLDGGGSWSGVGSVSGNAALLLRSTDLLRLQPDGQNGGSGSIGWRAWDRSSGAAGSTADTSANGGNSAFSTATDSATVVVTSVNDAPVLTPAAPTLPAIGEDSSAPAGRTVAAIVGSSISDVDSGASTGIALVASSGSHGQWQYSLDGGTSWQAVGSVSSGSALLLGASHQLRYLPDGSRGETATLGFRAWDASTGSAGSRVDAGSTGGSTGGSTAFSSATDTLSQTVLAANDAPVLSPAAPVLPAIAEDAANGSGQTVAALLGSSVTDLDAGALQGIALTATTVAGAGAWQFSTDGGGSWQAVGAVAEGSALLLRSTDRIRYQPDGLDGGSASLAWRAWDQTSGTAGTVADAGVQGGSTAFSTATDSATLTITAANDAPVLTPAAPVLAGLTEDQTANAGQTVASLVAGSISDVDGGALSGIAINAQSAGNGSWQYSLDGGASWQAVGAVSDAGALLLRDSDRLRFVPDAANATSATIGFRAWDRSSGSAGSKVSTAAAGGGSAFSSATDTAAITVSAANDAPVLVPIVPTLASVAEWNTNPPGQTVASFAGGSLTDVDAGAVQGIAVTGELPGSGAWQYSLDGGASWLAMAPLGTLGDAAALLLRATDLVRLVPDGASATTGSLTYRGWDQTSGSAGSLADASAHGGSSAFSSGTDTAGITVSNSNAAPVLTPAAPMLPALTEDDGANAGQTVATLLGSSVTDPNAGAAQGIAVIGQVAGAGGWQFSTNGGASWQAVGAVSDGAALLLRATDRLRYLPDGSGATSASIDYRAWDQTSGSAGTLADASTHGGGSAFSSATDTASVSVSALNDAPVLMPAGPVFAGLSEDQLASAGQTVASLLGTSITDTDGGALQGIAVTSQSAGGGSWQYSLDGGATWAALGAVSDAQARLLRPADLLRHVPDGANGGSASLGWRAWDQTTGSAGSLADAGANGGTSAFSSGTDTATLTIAAVNDAPVLVPAAPVLPAQTEDEQNHAGHSVATLLGSQLTDVDSGALQGVALTGQSAAGGGWQFSTDGGGSWQALGAVSDSSALLLRSVDRVRFVPDGIGGSTASLDFRGWDRSTGSAGNLADASVNGGSSAFSSATDTATLAITAVNDAPVLLPAGPVLAGLTEDDTNTAGQTVASFVSGITDVDAGALSGIAVMGFASGNGAWQFSLDGGGSWAALGAVSDASARLLRSTDLVRFVPDGSNATSASLSYRAWDQSTGSAGALADAGVNGGSSAFSSATDTATISVTAVNDAPVLTPTAPVLASVDEDDTTGTGQTVASLLGSSVNGVDAGALQGIAITGHNPGNGSWQTSTDGGASWSTLGSVSDGSALLLRSTDRIRFVPDGSGADSASLAYRAWDQTSGSAGSLADASTHGGSSAFSSATDTATLGVTAVNDAPVLTPAAPVLPGLTEDQSSHGGQSVAAIVGGSITDADSGALQGIALTGLVPGSGSWQYSLNGGASWAAVGSVSDASALLLRAGDLLRLVPDGQNGTAASISYRAWDQTAGSAGSKVDSSAAGGTNAFSSASDTASLSVTALNDAPVLTPAAPSLPTLTEDDANPAGQTVAALLGSSVADVDGGALQGIAVIGRTAQAGAWQYSLDGGASWQAVGTVSDAAALLLRATDRLRLLPDGSAGSSNSLSYQAWDQTSGVAGGLADVRSAGGSSAFSLAADTLAVSVTGVNDAPVLVPAAPVLPTLTEDTLSHPGASVASLLGSGITDADAAAVQGLAVTAASATAGAWQYSTDGGASWQALPAVSDGSALLLRGTDRLRLLPAGNQPGSASLGWRAWDQTSGSAGSLADASGHGGSSAFSSATDTATVTITAVNDAPVLTATAPVLATIAEHDTDPAGQTVASFTAGSISDPDGSGLAGIAVVGQSPGSGSWQFSLDGGATWAGFGSVGAANALLLRDTDLVRLVPDGVNATSASFQFRAWDGSSGTAGSLADASSPGGSSAFSSATDSASLSVVVINDAPALTPGAPVLPALTEDQSAHAGQAVGTLVAGRIADADASALTGVAITSQSPGSGSWQYSLDGGATWMAVGSVSDGSALLLRATDRLRYQPDGSGADSAAIGYLAWDQTAGSAGQRVDSSVRGGSSAFSAAADTASVSVSAVNDAPVLVPSSPVLPAVSEDDVGSAGQSVAALLGGSVSDADTGALQGIALVEADAGAGSWQYSLDGGASWLALGPVADDDAVLLRPADRLRFVPDGLDATSATLRYRAWDQTSGSAGGRADTAAAAGGSSAFSSASDTASVVATAVNDAPVLTPAAPVLAPITEDAGLHAGLTVATLLGSSVADVDAGALQGVAVTGLVPGNGRWQYSVNDGASWVDVGAVSDSAALLLRATDVLRLVPDGSDADSAQISYRAWDQSNGVAGGTGDTTVHGGSSAFSSATDTATLAITAVNDAPVLVPAGPVLAGLTEDDTNTAGQTVASFVGGITDVDAGALSGIAVMGSASGNGAWQFSLDGGASWAALGVVSDASARLLRSTDLVRFVPDGSNATSASLSYRAWDQSTGSAGALADAGVNGGSSAVSSATDIATISVTAVNDAPVLTPTAPMLASVDEDTTTGTGQTVASLLGSSVDGVDAGALQGIAITGHNPGNGSWQTSTDGGASWSTLGSVSDGSALLLRSTDRIRFVPDGSGADSASLAYRAWDQTSGSAGSLADASTHGGSSAFGSATDTATLSVTAVNDAPVLAPTAPVLPTIAEHELEPAGQTVASFTAGSISDPDGSGLAGIAVIGQSPGSGAWQFSLDGGSTWAGFGNVAAGSALLLRDTDLVRLVPDGVNATSASFQFRAWDGSTGTAGSLADATSPGGSSAFSSASDTASVVVSLINAAPTLTPGAPVFTTLTEDQAGNAGQAVGTLLAGRITDADAGALTGVAITSQSPGGGSWQYSLDGGTTWAALGSVGDDSALLLRATDRIRFVPDGSGADSASLDFRAWDQSAGSAGSLADTRNAGGSSAFSSSQDTASITVSAVNDAPLLVPRQTVLPAIGEDDLQPAGYSVASLRGGVSDADGGSAAVPGIAITGSAPGQGSWQYSLDGGASWQAVGSVAPGSALLLRDTDLLRLVPDGRQGGVGSFDYRAWDGSAGSDGQRADASQPGGSSAFSSAGDTVTQPVTEMPDAPVLQPAAPALPGVPEWQTDPAGTSVSALLGGTLTDADGGTPGIALTGGSAQGGRWQYTRDGGSLWQDVGPVSEGSALLLGPDDRLRLLPAGPDGGSGSLQFRGWDAADAAAAGSRVAVAGPAFSQASDLLQAQVLAQNDAPRLGGTAGVVIGIGAGHRRPVPSHTTRHAGPHRAVREFEVRRTWARPGRRSSAQSICGAVPWPRCPTSLGAAKPRAEPASPKHPARASPDVCARVDAIAAGAAPSAACAATGPVSRRCSGSVPG